MYQLCNECCETLANRQEMSPPLLRTPSLHRTGSVVATNRYLDPTVESGRPSIRYEDRSGDSVEVLFESYPSRCVPSKNPLTV